MKILVVDDDKDIVDLLALYLSNNSYQVTKAYDGLHALELLNKEVFDLIILDVMMPRMDGIETCLNIRKKGLVTPVIFLTAKSFESDVVHGLSAGADDYIVKPFSSVVLMAKVSALLRRQNQYNSALSQMVVRIDDLEIELQSCKVRINDTEIKLTPKEFEILRLLAENRGRVYNLSQIHDLVWGENCWVSENSIMVHIANLRNKIEKDTRNPQYIKTVWGFGYKI